METAIVPYTLLCESPFSSLSPIVPIAPHPDWAGLVGLAVLQSITVSANGVVAFRSSIDEVHMPMLPSEFVDHVGQFRTIPAREDQSADPCWRA